METVTLTDSQWALILGLLEDKAKQDAETAIQQWAKAAKTSGHEKRALVRLARQFDRQVNEARDLIDTLNAD